MTPSHEIVWILCHTFIYSHTELIGVYGTENYALMAAKQYIQQQDEPEKWARDNDELYCWEICQEKITIKSYRIQQDSMILEEHEC